MPVRKRGYWWSQIAAVSAIVSTILILLFIVTPGPTPGFAAGVEKRVLIANVGILMVLWWHWPTPVGGT